MISGYVISSQIICTEVAGEMVLMDMSRDAVFGIGEIGLLIWNSLSNGTPYQDMVVAIAAEYEVDPSILEKDVQQFLQTLVDKGLLQSSQ